MAKLRCVNLKHTICKKHMVIITWSLVVLTLLSLVRFTKETNVWLIDLFSHFPVQYGIIALGLLGLCLWKKTFLPGSLALLLAIVNLSVFAEYRPFQSPPHPIKPTLSVYLANVWRINPMLGRMQQEVLHMNADCVFLMEVTPEHIEPLQSFIQHFPYRIERPMKDFRGFLFLSLHPIERYQIITDREHGNRPLLSAELKVGQTPVSFYGVHPHTPAFRHKFHKRNRQLMWLAKQIADISHPVVVAGDLNTTPFSPAFQELLLKAGLKGTRSGAGWYPSWPVYMPLFWLPIDHILVSTDVHVYRLSTGRFIGSDHYPVIAEIGL